jgi:hypothetical protein
MNKHTFPEQFKPSVYAGPLPCAHAPLGGELVLYDGSRGLYQAVAFIGGVRISLGVFCHRAAACAAIAEAHEGEVIEEECGCGGTF